MPAANSNAGQLARLLGSLLGRYVVKVPKKILIGLFTEDFVDLLRMGVAGIKTNGYIDGADASERPWG